MPLFSYNYSLLSDFFFDLFGYNKKPLPLQHENKEKKI